MADTTGSTANASMSPNVLHTDCGIAVSGTNMRWFIAECKPTKEKAVRTLLQNTGYEVYLASQSETVVYKCRNRRVKEKIVIPGKVFVHTKESDLMSIMLAFSSVWRFMLDRTTKDRRFAFVSDDDMQNLQYMLGSAANPVLITADKLKVGQKVKVMRGALAGLEGWFYREAHTSFVVIKVTMGTNHYVYTEVPIEDITPLDTSRPDAQHVTT